MSVTLKLPENDGNLNPYSYDLYVIDREVAKARGEKFPESVVSVFFEAAHKAEKSWRYREVDEPGDWAVIYNDNDMAAYLREKTAAAVTDYLLENDGVVGEWPSDMVTFTADGPKGKRKVEFRYFATDWVVVREDSKKEVSYINRAQPGYCFRDGYRRRERHVDTSPIERQKKLALQLELAKGRAPFLRNRLIGAVVLTLSVLIAAAFFLLYYLGDLLLPILPPEGFVADAYTLFQRMPMLFVGIPLFGGGLIGLILRNFGDERSLKAPPVEVAQAQYDENYPAYKEALRQSEAAKQEEDERQEFARQWQQAWYEYCRAVREEKRKLGEMMSEIRGALS